jgi:hypothetical protein
VDSPSQQIEREYFYVMDDKGQLFLNDCKYKNFISCLKDKQFLNLFFHLLRKNNSSKYLEYPWMSPCMKEMNYLRIEDKHACCVFGSFHQSGEEWQLKIGSSEIVQLFNPSLLSVDAETGRFYHKLSTHRHLKGFDGLLHGFISQQLSGSIRAQPLTTTNNGDNSEDEFILNWKGTDYPIPPVRTTSTQDQEIK